MSEPENIRLYEWYVDGFTRNRATYTEIEGGWVLVADNPAHAFQGQGETQIDALRAFVAQLQDYKPPRKG